MKKSGDPELLGPFRRFVLQVVHLWYRFRRGMTLGVRAAAFDDKGRIFLVRHTYIPGWYLPGGGVEVDETAFEALEKELLEEGNVTLGDAPTLFQVYFNDRVSNRDHVLFYVCRNVRQRRPKVPNKEIAESGFFPLDDLPAGTTGATRRRLAEIAGEAEIQQVW